MHIIKQRDFLIFNVNYLFYRFNLIYSVAATISFDQSAYSIAEDGGPVQPVLVLSNPSSVDITIRVIDTATTATGT